ncbi:uncharacterized protein LOC117812036 isoform X3 [Notolabrus celidotus]|uniref:uncharacterized protein LOC117812036 isoform X3 n=1 Tax=Notolabrus celidotus TaxID=1203425 RepID=UPI00149005E3|nr:uncharacterized protein LOC117812036 isoform X3 [Notolabrus celidotus]
MVRCHRWSVWTRTHDLRELPSRWTLRFIAANTSSSVIQDAALPNMFTVEKTPPRLRLTQMCLEITCPATPWALHLHVLSGSLPERGRRPHPHDPVPRCPSNHQPCTSRRNKIKPTENQEVVEERTRRGGCRDVGERCCAKKNYDLWIKKGAVLVCLHEAASQPHCHSSRCQSTGYHSL